MSPSESFADIKRDHFRFHLQALSVTDRLIRGESGDRIVRLSVSRIFLPILFAVHSSADRIFVALAAAAAADGRSYSRTLLVQYFQIILFYSYSLF